jgi:hypothetical protein
LVGGTWGVIRIDEELKLLQNGEKCEKDPQGSSLGGGGARVSQWGQLAPNGQEQLFGLVNFLPPVGDT